MVDIVVGRLGNRWCSAGLIWQHDQKGVWINLLTVTLDISNGKFGGTSATWEATVKRMRKPS
jgi:hypothetical protein